MKPQSAKAKGRSLQKWVVEKLLENFPQLTEKDIRSTSMGAQGEDVKLSEAAFKVFPFYVECKSRAALSLYSFYEQADTKDEVLVVVKANRKKPLVILDAEVFIRIIKELYANHKDH